MIIIFYAFAREIAPFKRRLKNRRRLEHRDLRGFRARVDGRELVAIATGVGLMKARTAAQRAFEAFPDAEVAIGTGVAGALMSNLRPGDLILANHVIAHRSPSSEPEHLPKLDVDYIGKLARILKASELPYSSGAILTSHRVLPDRSAKELAKKKTGAIAVDMETAALAEATISRGIQFACVRTIIDGMDDDLVKVPIDEDGRVRALATATHLIRNPQEIFKLPGMMKNLNRATRAIADALEAIVRAAEKPGRPPETDEFS